MSFLRLLAASLLLVCEPALAGVTAERTRVIVHQGQCEVSLVLANQNDYPVMVQAWVDDGSPDGGPDEADAPIIPLPAMFQLAAGQRQSLRLLYVGPAPSNDRESLYWLNLLEIPPDRLAGEAPGSTRLTMTMRTQMKVFYRPAALKTGVEKATARLALQLKHGQLFATNASSFHITLAGLVVCGGEAMKVEGDGLIPPLATARIAASIPACLRDETLVQFNWIDDEGNIQIGRSRLVEG